MADNNTRGNDPHLFDYDNDSNAPSDVDANGGGTGVLDESNPPDLPPTEIHESSLEQGDEENQGVGEGEGQDEGEGEGATNQWK